MSTLKVLTLNVWNREGPYAERLPLLRAWIRQLSPDVVALQEVYEDQLPQLLGEALPHRAFLGAGLSGSAVASVYPIEEQLPELLPGVDASAPGGIALGVRLATPNTVVPVVCVSIFYAKPLDGWKRELVVPDLVGVAERLRHRGDYPTVLAGDFNAEPESAEMRFMRGLQSLDSRSAYFCDAWERAGEGSGATWTRRNAYSGPWGLPDRRIDYVYVRAPGVMGAGAVQACRVVCDQPEGGVWASDHFGVFAELVLDTRS